MSKQTQSSYIINSIIIALIGGLYGCSQGVAPSQEALTLADQEGLSELMVAEPEASTVGALGQHTEVSEQWLHVWDFEDATAKQDTTLCQAFYTAPNQDVICVDADMQGQALVYWVAPEQDYRLTGSFEGGKPFAVQGRTDATPDIYNSRPVRVLSDASLERLYSSQGIEQNAEGHSVVVSARVNDAQAEGVNFGLTPMDDRDNGAEYQVVYAADDGSFDGALDATSKHGHGVFVNVPRGYYSLNADMDGHRCSTAIVWTDGTHGQLIAPEITCD